MSKFGEQLLHHHHHQSLALYREVQVSPQLGSPRCWETWTSRATAKNNRIAVNGADLAMTGVLLRAKPAASDFPSHHPNSRSVPDAVSGSATVSFQS